MSPDADGNASTAARESSLDPSPDEMTELKLERDHSEDKSPDTSNHETQAKSNAKDPLRPRRKKARRACFACQRAHLTCGDERPCLRCIKRGLQDHCHDGVRKKAKYLHDAPNEALMPGVGGNFHSSSAGPQAASTKTPQVASGPVLMSPQDAYYGGAQTTNASNFDSYDQRLLAESPTAADSSIVVDAFDSRPGSMSAPGYAAAGSQHIEPMHNGMNPMEPPMQAQSQQYNTAFIDPSDPSFFNFDISGLNFGNHYGALEFGMLGHMSSGADEMLDDNGPRRSMTGASNMTFDNSTGSGNPYSIPGQGLPMSGSYADWSSTSAPRTGSAGQMFGPMVGSEPNFANAFAIGESSASISSASPATTNLDGGAYTSSPGASVNIFPHQQSQHDSMRQQAQQQSANLRQTDNPLVLGPQRPEPGKRRKRDASLVYSSVQAPYSYTSGFHSLTAFLQKRFAPQKTLRIAKALASIRPSFISCTKELNRDDLIFMEKCFQRTLLQYEEFLNVYGTPTVICRRTGEIAGVNKEFSLLTGWRRDVLLGKEANFNANTGGTASGSGTATGNSSRGQATPRIGHGVVNTDTGRPQPVFLAELLDDDSVIQFYEDFAKLAFGDSRGYAMQPCKLLKYRTKDDPSWDSEEHTSKANGGANAGRTSQHNGNNGNLLLSDSLGDRDGKVSCMVCWTVKRDVFDIPMLLVMNFLPRI